MPLKAAYEAEKKRGDEIHQVRKKIEELRAKIEEAERRYVQRGRVAWSQSLTYSQIRLGHCI